MSSKHSSPSPPQGSTAAPVDESQLPAGQCRYILLHPEIKGLRCACVSFTLNTAMPGAACDCGHLACFHVKTAEPATDGHDLDLLRKRLQALEDREDEVKLLRQEVQMLQAQLGRSHEVVVRVSELEDVVEKSKEDFAQDLRASYRHMNRLWHSVGEVERQGRQHDHHLGHVNDRLQALQAVEEEQQRLGQRQLEFVDENIALEERIIALEESESAMPPQGRSRRKSTSDPTPPGSPPAGHPPGPQASDDAALTQEPTPAQESTPTPGPMTTMPYRSGSSDTVWTVHVSILPTLSQPFPFERHTNAYKRCLSRGLHQMVAINGHGHESFVSAVDRAFGSLLKGRPWMPLQAQPCTAERLAGLPMLRQLEASVLDGKYDIEFLRRRCAVCDATGKIDHLYIAMRDESLSWHFLRRAPVFVDGLEASWLFDPILDQDDPFEDDDDNGGDDDDDDDNGEADDVARPSAGDIVSLKRAASEMSRSSSFGSATTAAEDGPREYSLS